MGLTYAYELIADGANAGRLLTAMADHLAPDDRDRLLVAGAAHPGEVPTHVVHRHELSWPITDMHLPEGDVCFVFHFRPDAVLVAYDAGSRMARPPGRVPVGCVYTRVHRGERFVVVRAAACTGDMSRMFRDSPVVRDTFAAMGRAGGAAAVLFDDEQGDGIECVWPHAGRLSPWADVNDLYDDDNDDDMTPQADRYAAAVLAAMPTP